PLIWPLSVSVPTLLPTEALLARVIGAAQVLLVLAVLPLPTLNRAALIPAPFRVSGSLTVIPPVTSSCAPLCTVVPALAVGAGGVPRAVAVVMRSLPALTVVAPA